MGASYEYKKHDFDSEFTKKTDWDDIGSELFENYEYVGRNEEGRAEKRTGHMEKEDSELDQKLSEYYSSDRAKQLQKSRSELLKIYDSANTKIDKLYERAKTGDGEIVIERDERRTLPMVNYGNGTKREAKWAHKYQNREKKPFFMRKSKWNKVQEAKSKIFFEIENPDFGKITKKEFVADNGTMSKTVDEFGREKIVFGEIHDLLKMEKEAEKTKAEAKTYEDQYIFGENEVVMDVFDKKIKEKQARDHREQNK